MACKEHVRSNRKDVSLIALAQWFKSVISEDGHIWVNHSSRECTVSTTLGHLAYTNDVESLWATFKCAFHSIYHHIIKRHLNRYVGQFACKHNIRSLDTKYQMAWLGNGLTTKDLIA